jgi:type II secretory pathway pseudopilin PulG
MNRSFTLFEVIIATSILGIVALIGWGSMQAQLPRFRMVRAARTFKSDLMNIRSLAVHTNRETRLRLTRAGGDCDDGLSWGGAWEMAVGNRASASDQWDLLPEDSFDDGTDDDQSEAYVDLGGDVGRAEKWVCLQQWDPLTGPIIENQDAIVFSPRGWVSNPADDFGDSGYIEFTFVNQAAVRAGVSDTVTVLVSRAGLVRLVSMSRLAVDVAEASTAESEAL